MTQHNHDLALNIAIYKMYNEALVYGSIDVAL